MKISARDKLNSFKKQYKINVPTVENLTLAIEDMGYQIIRFNSFLSDPDVANLIEALDLGKYVQSERGFTYADDKYRLVFINEDLSVDEELIVLAHEAGHIFCGHFQRNTIMGEDVKQEHEANEFVHWLTDRVPSIGSSGKRSIPYVIIIASAALLLTACLAVIMITGGGNDRKDRNTGETVNDAGIGDSDVQKSREDRPANKDVSDPSYGLESSDALPFDGLTAIKEGDTVYLGSYEQDNVESSGKEDISWIVLHIENGSALLLSEYALDCHMYNDTDTGECWKDCTVRTWLNSEFYQNAFTDKEREYILVSHNTNRNNSVYGTDGGGDTDDLVFLLSFDEAAKYLPSDLKKQCMATAYAAAQGAYQSAESGTSWWFLRSPGASPLYAMVVHDGEICHQMSDGTVKYDEGLCSLGFTSTSYGPIRPAVWVDITDIGQ